MAKQKFKIDDINIGDEVHYKDYYVNMKDENLYKWKVVAKLQGTLIIEQYIDGKVEKRAIEIKHILDFKPAQ